MSTIPFKLTVTNTNVYGKLMNPDSAVIANSVDNSLVASAGLGQDGDWRVIGLVIMGNSDGAPAQLGVIDDAANWTPILMDEQATGVASGGVVMEPAGSVLGRFTLDSHKCLAIKYTGAGAGTFVYDGYVRLAGPERTLSQIKTAVATANAGLLLDEEGQLLVEDSAAAPALTPET